MVNAEIVDWARKKQNKQKKLSAGEKEGGGSLPRKKEQHPCNYWGEKVLNVIEGENTVFFFFCHISSCRFLYDLV